MAKTSNKFQSQIDKIEKLVAAADQANHNLRVALNELKDLGKTTYTIASDDLKPLVIPAEDTTEAAAIAAGSSPQDNSDNKGKRGPRGRKIVVEDPTEPTAEPTEPTAEPTEPTAESEN